MKKSIFDDDEGYVNDSGLYVFTAAYLLNRGYCCGNGCLHCPFDYKNVVDSSKKERLFQARKDNINHEKNSVR